LIWPGSTARPGTNEAPEWPASHRIGRVGPGRPHSRGPAITYQGPPRPGRKPRGGVIWIPASLSLLLHIVIAAAFIVIGRRETPMAEPPDKPSLVELVLVEQQGLTDTPASPPVPEATPKEDEAPPAPPLPRPAAPVEAETLPVPPPPPPPQPTRDVDPPKRPVPPPIFDLTGTASDSNAIASGTNVVPASPDKSQRNRPPPYPLEAARRGQEGAVELLIHISPEGIPIEADVVRGSGHVLLDRAARDAVLTWRFLPAVRDGAPIESEMTMLFRFQLN
jgi:protein TonB